MIKKSFPSLIIVLFVLAVLAPGCMKKESFSIIPQISLLGFEKIYGTRLYPDSGRLSIGYQDGDGDIGLAPGDTFPPYDSAGPYYYNLVITYYEKQNGIFKQKNLTFPLSARIPVLTPNDPGKPIKGFIDDLLPMDPAPLFDTIKLDVFIYDRALHKSNVISTPEITLKRK